MLYLERRGKSETRKEDKRTQKTALSGRKVAYRYT